MARRSLCIAFVTIISLVHKVFSNNGIFTYGVVNEYPVEFDAINFVVNTTQTLNSTSIILKNANVPEKRNLYKQASLFLDQNVVALIEGSNTKMCACALSEVTGIPLIRLHGDSRPSDQCDKAIQMSAGYRDYAHATLAILKTFHWESLALVFDESRLYEAGYFYAIAQRSNMTVNLVQLSEQSNNESPTSSILKAMEEIENVEAEVILLYTGTENIELMLQKKPCQDKNGYKWIIQGKAPFNLSSNWNNIVLAFKLPVIHSSVAVPIQNRSSKSSKELISIVHDTFQVINDAVKMEPCSTMNGSAITSKDTNAMLTCMRKVNLDGLTGAIHFNEYGKRKGIELEILNLRNNSLVKIGTWNSTKGAVLFESVIRNMEDPLSKGSLEGRNLRAVVVLDAPFVIEKRLEDGSIKYTGYCIDLLNELAKNLKFTYEIYTSPDGLYGAETENGTWNGIVGELMNKRADIAAAAITVTERREKVVDFTVPYMYYTNELLIKETFSAGAISLFQFMLPFHRHVWISTLASQVAIAIAVFVINYFSPYGYKDENGKGTSEEFSFFNSVWFSLACMLQQGGDNTPRSLSGRILTGCYWFCILVWVSTYTANLAAFFTVTNTDLPINNLEDIVQSSYHVAVVDSSSTYEAFKTSQYEPHRKIWNRMSEEKTIIQDTPAGIQLVRDRDEFAFIGDGPILRLAAIQPPCGLTTVPGLSTAQAYSFALQANDTALKDFTLAILRLSENDFLDQLKREWWELTNECPQKRGTTLSRKRIDLRVMLGVYVVMGVGIFVAFMTLIVEILWVNKRFELLN